jgi:dTDP-4-dehydrorhamnose reductase
LPKSLLVTGASGYLGRALSRRASRLGTLELHSGYASRPQRVCAGRPVRLDMSLPDDVQTTVLDLAPDVIIHTAAAVPGEDEARMLAVNADGAGALAEAASKLGARLVHVSTDVLFDGTQAPYSESDEPSPTNAYSRSKAAGEATVRSACPSAAIVRTSLIYGLQEMDRGIAGIAAQLEAGGEPTLFRDVTRQPIWVESLAEVLLALAMNETGYAGVLNVVGKQAIDRATFARKLLEWWQVPGRERASDVLAADLPEPPPLDLRMNTKRVDALLGIALPGVDEVLGES